MKLIYNKIFLEHDTGMHPENKKRLESLSAVAPIPETDIEDGEKFLGLFHTEEYARRVKDACAKKEHLDPDTIASSGTYLAATRAVGATIMASRSGDFALVRPPGHHAYPDRSSGFCIFNNIAIAVQKLVNEGKRVFIFDFDGHLGDGTVKAFYGTDRVLYWSLHEYPAFPGGGSINEIGEGKGKGYTINVPLPAGSGDDIYIKAVERFLPAAIQFKPDVTAVSAGFDAHQHDPLLNLRVTLGTYYKLGKLLKENFKNVFATLEGGYNIEVFVKCLFSFLDGINGAKPRFTEQQTYSTTQTMDEYEAQAYRLKKNLSPYWKL